MPLLPTNLGVKYAKGTLKKFYEKAVTPEITNQEYESELKVGGGDRIVVLSFLNNVTMNDYTPGTAMSTEQWMGDINNTLTLSQKKYHSFEIDNLDKFEAYVNDLDSTLIQDASDILAETIDAYVLGFYTSTKVGNRVGSDYDSDAKPAADSGVATVTTGTGAVELTDPGIHFAPVAADGAQTSGGISTTALVGIGIKFDGDGAYYKISAWTDSDTFTITDWNDSTYTGGTKTSVEFVLEAVYPKTVSKTTIYADIASLSQKLSDDKMPKSDRWIVVPSAIAEILKQATELTPAVQMAYEDVVLNGLVGKVAGFKVFENEQISGSSTKGWRCLAGHKSFITFAHAYTESRIVISEGNFAKKYQGLNVYGALVPVERRKAGAYAYWILSGSGNSWLE